ncbi:myoneurin-like isoform X2 [Belonocnema kinseyi]|uniref:myoneurin-like isoform X2 n=1 Tax=Belonocnema kinseyi TaxID=2817044 RepID=UPI00143DA0A5|nr:myoneurin-like isoform X2 [Belonocnema kinseyi]
MEVRSEAEAVSSTSIDITVLLHEHKRLINENAELKKSNLKYCKELDTLQKERVTIKQINDLLCNKRKIILDLEETIGSLTIELNRAKWQLQVAEESQKRSEQKNIKTVKLQGCQTEFEVIEKSIFHELEQNTQRKTVIIEDVKKRLDSTSKRLEDLSQDFKENVKKQKHLESSLEMAKKVENELRCQLTKLSEAAGKAFAEIQDMISRKKNELITVKDDSEIEKKEEEGISIEQRTLLKSPTETVEMNIEIASSAMTKHNEIQKILKSKTYSCDECGREYPNLKAVKRHQRQHSEINFKCKLCRKVYALKQNCIQHLQVLHHINQNVGNFISTVKKLE